MPTPRQGYTIDSEKVPGTTTVIGRFKDSGGLLYWAFNQGRLAEQGKIQKLYDKADEAADIGTVAHEMIELHIHDKPPESALEGLTDANKEKACEAYGNALNWLEQTRIEVLAEYQEIQLVSPHYRFGGTPDAIGRLNGKLILLDWKTSNGVYQDYLIQLAAYKHLIEDGVRMDTGESLGLTIDGGMYLCRFAKDFPDFSAHYFRELPEAWEQFTLFRKAYDIDKTLKRRAA